MFYGMAKEMEVYEMFPLQVFKNNFIYVSAVVFDDMMLNCFIISSKLGLHLPHPVDHKSGKAQWDAKTETLKVTLRIRREYDFMNF